MLVKNKWEENGLYIEYEGIVSADEMLDTDKNYGDTRFDKIRYIIVDLSLVTGIKFKRSKLEIKAAQDSVASAWNNSIQLIFIIRNKIIKKEIEFFIKKMKQGINNWDLFIVKSIKEARAIL